MDPKTFKNEHNNNETMRSPRTRRCNLLTRAFPAFASCAGHLKLPVDFRGPEDGLGIRGEKSSIASKNTKYRDG